MSAAFAKSSARSACASRAFRRFAGVGLFLLTIAVTPANVYMYEHADLFPAAPPALLFWRLPLQLLLLWL